MNVPVQAAGSGRGRSEEASTRPRAPGRGPVGGPGSWCPVPRQWALLRPYHPGGHVSLPLAHPGPPTGRVLLQRALSPGAERGGRSGKPAAPGSGNTCRPRTRDAGQTGRLARVAGGQLRRACLGPPTHLAGRAPGSSLLLCPGAGGPGCARGRCWFYGKVLRRECRPRLRRSHGTRGGAGASGSPPSPASFLSEFIF